MNNTNNRGPEVRYAKKKKKKIDGVDKLSPIDTN